MGKTRRGTVGEWLAGCAGSESGKGEAQEWLATATGTTSSRALEKRSADTHGRDLAPEASPARWRDLAVVAGGNGRVYLIDPRHGRVHREIVLGGDIDGTPVVTPDGCVLVTTEQQHVPGQGGVFKIDPARPPNRAVLWFEPAGAARFCHWQGGLVGSATHNGAAAGDTRFPPMAAWIGVDGKLVVVRHDITDAAAESAWCPLKLRQLPRPQVVFSLTIGGSIATPVWAADGRLVVPWDRGLVMLEYVAARGTFRMLARMDGPGFDATPLIHDGRVYAASRDGWLYCLGAGK